jgi:hypothetical protein
LTADFVLCDIEAGSGGSGAGGPAASIKSGLAGKPETACTSVVSGLSYGSQVTAAFDELECVLKGCILAQDIFVG